MSKTQKRPVARRTVIAVQAALAALALVPVGARAADANDEARAQTEPGKSIEFGMGNVNRDSQKFGEYNGLNREGPFFIGDFDLRGGGAYDSGDASRWRATGSNLGLDTRNLQLQYGVQGNYQLNLGYDGIVKNYSDSYQTIYNGAGGTALTLPSNFPAVRGGSGLTTWNNTQAPGPAAAIPQALHPFDAGTKRQTIDLGGSKFFGNNWLFSVSERHQEKDGTKLTGVNMNRFSGPSAIVPEPISQRTDQVEASARYASGPSYFNATYYGSFFRNNVNTWTVQFPGQSGGNPLLGDMAHLYGAPDNQAHQLNLAGGYNFSRTTKLVVSGSYAKLTQNEAFPYMAANWTMPSGSTDAKVYNSQFLARLTARPMPKLGLSASYKFDDRDNRTPVRTFITNGDVTTASAAPNIFTNEPNNRRQHTVNLDADYAFARGQAVAAGYEWQQISRKGQTYEETPFRAEKTTENTLRAEYRNTMAERLNGRIGYAYSQRRFNEYEEGIPIPVQDSPSPPVPGADPLLPGFHQFWLSDRNRDKLRGALNFQASDTVTLQGNLEYNRDKYTNLAYGLKESDSWVGNVDAVFAVSPRLSFNAYYTYEDMKSQLDSLAISRVVDNSQNTASAFFGQPPIFVPHANCAAYTNAANTYPVDFFSDPCRQWTMSQSDQVHTIGVGFTSKGQFVDRLTLTGRFTYTQATSAIPVAGGAYFSNGAAAPNATANFLIPAASFPDATSRLIDLRLNGTYAIDKASAVRLTYIYRRLVSDDWQYNAYTNSALGPLAVQAYVGPMQVSPQYAVQVIGVSYIYSFK